jgi:hypothetical protein
MGAVQSNSPNAVRGRLAAKRRKRRMVQFFVGLGCSLLALFSLGLGYWLFVWLGAFPVPDCLPGDPLYPRVVNELTQVGVLRPDEQLLFFVSESPFSMHSGSLCTDKRAIAYETPGTRLQVWSARYDEIADLHWEPRGIGITEFSNADSTITVTKTDGSWFTLCVFSDPATGRCPFMEVLRKPWESARPKATPPVPSPNSASPSP